MREVHTIIDDSEPDDQEGDMVGSSAGDDGGMSELKRQLKAKRAERVKAETLFRRLKDEEEDLAALIDTMERHEQDQGSSPLFPMSYTARTTFLLQPFPTNHRTCNLSDLISDLCGGWLAEHARNRPDWAGDPYFLVAAPESSRNFIVTCPAL